MAVTSLLSSLETFESSPTYFNVGSGGGATDNTDVFIEGAQSGGRRCDNATNKGFGAIFSSTDLSAAGEHIKLWVFCFHWSAVTDVQVRISDGTNDDDHVYPVADIPVRGGWIPIWVDVSRTPETGGSANEAAIDRAGSFITIGNVGGAGDNWIIDEIMHGTSGYRWDGSSGTFGSFRTYEGTNVEGVFITQDGADVLFSRLEIGSSTATTFTDSGFTIVCPDQALVASTFMGLTIDLQNASTAISLSAGAIVSGNPSGATNRPDLLVTSTSGTFDMDTTLLNGFRTIELNSQCSLTNSTILNSGVVDATVAGSNGADLTGTSILSSIVSADGSALVWDVAADPDGELNDMTFSKGTAAHHALELGTNSPLSVTLRNWTVTGFNASNNQNDSTFNVLRSSGTVTINVIGGSGNFSYKSAGATVNVVLDPVTTLITVKDEDDVDFQNVRVLVEAGDNTGDLPFEEVVTQITRSGSTATVSHTAHGLSNGDKVAIRGANEQEYNGVFSISNVSANAYDYTVTGTPASPATGTITSTGVVLSGLTDANGEISASRTFSVDQNVRGKARKSTGSPVYKSFDFTDVVDNVNGLSKTIQMVIDE